MPFSLRSGGRIFGQAFFEKGCAQEDEFLVKLFLKKVVVKLFLKKVVLKWTGFYTEILSCTLEVFRFL